MDRTEEYRDDVKRVVLHYAKFPPSHGEIRLDAVCDDERGRYALVHAGWNLRKRVHGMLLYVRVEDAKVIIEYDGVNEGISSDLIEAGVSADDIVLAYRHEQHAVANA